MAEVQHTVHQFLLRHLNQQRSKQKQITLSIEQQCESMAQFLFSTAKGLIILELDKLNGWIDVLLQNLDLILTLPGQILWD